jgi:hypothetical protein
MANTHRPSISPLQRQQRVWGFKYQGHDGPLLVQRMERFHHVEGSSYSVNRWLAGCLG